MSDSIVIVGVRITNELTKHWAQGYHRAIDASSRDFWNYDQPECPAGTI